MVRFEVLVAIEMKRGRFNCLIEWWWRIEEEIFGEKKKWFIMSSEYEFKELILSSLNMRSKHTIELNYNLIQCNNRNSNKIQTIKLIYISKWKLCVLFCQQ